MRHFIALVGLLAFSYVSGPLALAATEEGFLGLILKQETPTKVVVKGTASGASAQKAGVKDEDVLESFKGKKVQNIGEFIKTVKATKPGSFETLKIKRAGKTIAFKLLVVSRETFLGAGIDAMKGKQIPELTATSVATNEKFVLSKLAGTPVVLELWATWCPACAANIPVLEAVAKKYDGKVKVVALSFESPAKVRTFFGDHKVAYDLVATESTDRNLSFMNNSSIPKFIVINAKGIVVEVLHQAQDLGAVLDKLD